MIIRTALPDSCPCAKQAIAGVPSEPYGTRTGRPASFVNHPLCVIYAK